MWSVGGIDSWIILPWAISALLLPNFCAYYCSFSLSTLLPVFLFGAMWGIGNINYGLTLSLIHIFANINRRLFVPGLLHKISHLLTLMFG